jgi:hypothetical protein
MSGGEASIRKGMERSWLRKPSLSQYKETRPIDPVFSGFHPHQPEEQIRAIHGAAHDDPQAHAGQPFNDWSILVRNVWSDITANSCRFEQSPSDDGGKIWETNWIATNTRVKDESEKAHWTPLERTQTYSDLPSAFIR